jgi:hypothetical protein
MTIPQIVGVIFIVAILILMIVASRHIEDVDWDEVEDEEEMP